MTEASVSALMPVHAGAASEYVRQAIASILSQSREIDEIVIVKDGPLSGDHEAAIADLQGMHSHVVVVDLPENRGAGIANQVGLDVASGTWIAKFDSDDISLPERVERQLAAAVTHGWDVCGTAMLEFAHDPARPTAVRIPPLEHAAIARRMRFNNPINHPTSLYRREAAISVGGYADLRFMQDYDLFARLLASGAMMGNLLEPLVLFRADQTMHRRRRGRTMLVLEWQLQSRLRGYGLISKPRSIVNLVVRCAFRTLPVSLVGLVMRRILSRKPPERI